MALNPRIMPDAARQFNHRSRGDFQASPRYALEASLFHIEILDKPFRALPPGDTTADWVSPAR